VNAKCLNATLKIAASIQGNKDDRNVSITTREVTMMKDWARDGEVGRPE